MQNIYTALPVCRMLFVCSQERPTQYYGTVYLIVTSDTIAKGFECTVTMLRDDLLRYNKV